MVKDLIGNVLTVGDKVHVQLVNPHIFGFIGEIVEPSHLVRVSKPGHILVSCVIAIPVEVDLEGVPQIVRVYDANKEEAMAAASKLLSTPPTPASKLN